MFERYTQSARRAVFYAKASTLLRDAPALDSVHLLEGLMWRKGSRAQLLFRLRDRLPNYGGQRFKAAAIKTTISGKNPQLTDDVKKILAWAAVEAEALNDYRIDTDHLLLGILCEPKSIAARHLEQAGITLENARKLVQGGRVRSKRPVWLNLIFSGWRERKGRKR